MTEFMIKGERDAPRDDWQTLNTESLIIIRDNLLKGIDKVAEHMDNGTMDSQAVEGAASPRQAGALTLMLLAKANDILDKRGIDPKW